MVTVIIPIYNSGPYLSACLRSVCDQEYGNLEILLIDDGSTDDSAQICAAFAAQDARIQYIRKENGGVSSARNVGLEAATGEYILFVDSDDTITPDCVARLVAPGADMAIAGAGERRTLSGEQIAPYFAEHYLQSGIVARIAPKLLRRHIVTHRFDESVSFGEDLLFNISAFEHAASVALLPETLYHYRTDNPTALTARRRLGDFEAMRKCYARACGYLQRSGYADLTNIAYRFYYYAVALLVKQPDRALAEQICSDAQMRQAVRRMRPRTAADRLLRFAICHGLAPLLLLAARLRAAQKKEGALAKDLLRVLLGKGFSLLSGILVGFVVPGLLGVTDYGYYKIYGLYTAYTALLHFGFADGILLQFAGQDYAALDQPRMRTLTRFYAATQAVAALLLMGVGACISDGDQRFICMALGGNLLIVNLTTHFQFVSQATCRFREQFVRGTLRAGLRVALVLLCTLWQDAITYRGYILAVNGIDLCLLVWYLITYRDITFGKGLPLKACIPQIRQLYGSGIVLTLAYQASQIAFALDQQFVSVLFPTAVYGVYAFAYSIVHIFSGLIASVSVVLFPALRQKGAHSAYYRPALTGAVLLSGLSLAGYFVMVPVIARFFPDYGAAGEYLRIILPAMLPGSAISVAMFTFCKLDGKNGAYLVCGCLALVLGAVCDGLAYWLFGTAQAISWASVLTLSVWYFLLGSRCGDRRGHLPAAVRMVLLGGGFYLITALELAWWQGMGLYLLLFACLWSLQRRK